MSEKATYTHGHHASVVASHSRRTIHDSAGFLIPHVKATDKILDLGCGPGSITVGLAKLAHQGSVIGGDSVEAVLEQARSAASEQNITNLSYQSLDANALPFADDTFDIVYCHQVLQHVADPVGVLREMKRVTKPGGIVAAREADYRSFAWFPESAHLDQWGRIYEAVAKANGAQPNAGRYVKSWATEAGFARSDLTFTWSSWNYQDEAGVAWGESWADRVLHSNFATTAKEKGLATQEELDTLSHAWMDWSRQEGALMVIGNGEILGRVH